MAPLRGGYLCGASKRRPKPPRGAWKGPPCAQGGPRNLARVLMQEVTAAVDVLLKGLVKTLKALVGLSKAV